MSTPAARKRRALKKPWVRRWWKARVYPPSPQAQSMYPSWLQVE
jgi:hypothetical protein